MKEFIDKLIERLEEEISWYETHGCNEDLKRGIIGANRHSIDLVNELAEEYKGNYESVGVLKQIMWERDIAIEQLHELGYEFGEKIAEEYKGKKVNSDLISRSEVIKELNEIYLDNPWDSKEDILEKAIGRVEYIAPYTEGE